MRVLLADDHRLLLEGLSNLLASNGIDVVGTALNGQEALELTRRLQPDVILMDIRMPVWNGLEATRQIMAELPTARIVMLTTSTEDEDLFEAVKSGAYGYLLKSMDSDRLVEALSQVMEGIPPFSPGLAGKILREFTRLAVKGQGDAHRGGRRDKNKGTEGEADLERLTEREREVLALVSQGLSYKEVGARLHLSPRTVKYHMGEIMARLHLDHRAQVLAYAGKAGISGKE